MADRARLLRSRVAAENDADGRAFAERCEGDRHHFRFIVSPDDAGELWSLRNFTRELIDQASRDQGRVLITSVA
jgi:type IV secretory pathway VirD2 relaxase